MESNDPILILAEYDAKRAVLDQFRVACESLINQLLWTAGFRVHSVTSRVKGRSELEEKLRRTGKGYYSLSEVTDIVGARVITYFEEEVDHIGNLVEREFLVDPKRSIDKRKLLDPDRFGYLSLHYICGLNEQRVRLLENQQYNGLLCEIQIRSLLQHAWAEIEHDLGYKAGAKVPAPIRRRFSRLAGLLEIGDREFTLIRSELTAYASRVKQDITNSPSSVAIDSVSLKAFIDSDEELRQIEAGMALSLGGVLHENSDISPLVELMHYVGLNTIGDLSQALRSHKDVLLRQWKIRMGAKQKTRDHMIRGLGLFQLFQVSIAQKGSVEDLRRAFDKFEVGEPAKRAQIAETVRKTVLEARSQSS